MSYIYHSEYNGANRTAQVFRKDGSTMFYVKCFHQMKEVRQAPFQTEFQAEDFAEDWVLENTNEEK
jgi:hypothetical protein